jgi:hypothetical protein
MTAYCRDDWTGKAVAFVKEFINRLAYNPKLRIQSAL